ncbi:hypothetical protein B488_08080 [Liberibacter crescens BT-1]|uniref:Transmembrane protein n=1 Tax=Liberibacter crescens (strain BT-1) TaxID=1215343 RepID=L0EVB7_LIBCB|nr:hypothetical protein [Liberibacter crescens]AGA64800.1 hypothetical protein B488_08080 [Liberibacter crescens BT-1]
MDIINNNNDREEPLIEEPLIEDTVIEEPLIQETSNSSPHNLEKITAPLITKEDMAHYSDKIVREMQAINHHLNDKLARIEIKVLSIERQVQKIPNIFQVFIIMIALVFIIMSVSFWLIEMSILKS